MIVEFIAECLQITECPVSDSNDFIAVLCPPRAMQDLMIHRSRASLETAASSKAHSALTQSSGSGFSFPQFEGDKLRHVWHNRKSISGEPPMYLAQRCSVLNAGDSTNFGRDLAGYGRKSWSVVYEGISKKEQAGLCSSNDVAHTSGTSWPSETRMACGDRIVALSTNSATFRSEILGKGLSLAATKRTHSGYRHCFRHPVRCSATVDAGAPGQYCESENEPPDCRFGAGIWKDLQQRLPCYASDFTDGFNLKAAAAILPMTFASLAPCLAFGGMITRLTACQMGLLETIISCAVAGFIYALFAGQPLTLLGPTGFMVTITGFLYKITVQAKLPFLPVYGWVGIWSGFFLFCLAGMEVSNQLVKCLTRFTNETFTTFISIGFQVEAFKAIGNLFKPTSPFPIETALLSLVLAGGTYVVAELLTQMRTTRLRLRPIGGLLADFGPAIAIASMSLLPILFFPTIPLPQMATPVNLIPTGGRPWLVPLFSIPLWAVAASAIPAVFVTLLIFLNQTMTTRLVNKFKSPLRKGAGYNLDLAVAGGIIGIMSMLGLPWMVPSVVPSLNHVRSLTTSSISVGVSGDNEAKRQENGVQVLENRLTGMMISVCVGGSLLFWSALRRVPLPVTSGLLVFMSLGLINGNQFVERVKLWLYDPELTPDYATTKKLPKPELHKFTMLQVACLWALWSLKESKWGITFPTLILALVVIRHQLAPRLVHPQYLPLLDPQ